MIRFCLVFALLIGILVLGLPVGFGLGVSATIISLFNDISLDYLAITVSESLDSSTLIAIPLFVLMSQILLRGKIGDNLFEAVNTWVRHLPGGLSVATVLSCAVFAAITGSGAATAVTIGTVAYPAMLKHGYAKTFTLGLLATGGTLGILIPPSIPMILYSSIITDAPLDKLFVAGVVPGLLLTLLLSIYAVWKSKRGGFTPVPKASMEERMSQTKRNIPGMLLPLFVIGGIYTGVFTPTEAAAVGVVYSIILTLVIYRTLKFKDIGEVCRDALATSCMICMIVVGAHLFGKCLTQMQLPQELTKMVADNNLTPLMFILAMNMLLLVLGAVLETVSVILLTTPLVMPIMQHLGLDPTWYGVVLTVNMSIALITPPVGMDLYVIKSLSKDITLMEVVSGVLPFILLMLFFLLLIIFVPQLSLWLPSFMPTGAAN